MENVNSENKVVEYEIITTKKYRQVVKVQFDEKYSDELDETKITPRTKIHPSIQGFGLGTKIDEEVNFSTKIVNEPPDRFITFLQQDKDTEKIVYWGKVVPNETKSVLLYSNVTNRGEYNEPVSVFLNCPHTLVEELWNDSKIKELSSYFVNFKVQDVTVHPKMFDNGLDCLKKLYKKRSGKFVNICVYEVGYYQRCDLPLFFDKDKTKIICLNPQGRQRG